jgi:hypothetical protein
VCRLSKAACQHHRENGSWPKLDLLLSEDQTLPALDHWQGPFVLEVTGNEMTIASAGPDRLFGTEDDVAAPPVSPD